jgi:hypothetical protein
VVREALRAVELPYDVVKPYSTWVSDDSLVDHEIVAPPAVMDEARMAEMVGGVVSVGVVTGLRVKEADTETLEESVRVQVAEVPEHEPDHPEKVESEAGVAVRVTEAPLARVAEHVVPQFKPPVFDVTVPWPVPLFVTETVYVEIVGGGGVTTVLAYS